MLNAQMCRSIGRRRGSSTGSSTHYVGAGDDDTVSPFAATHPTATDTCTQTTSLLLALCEEHGLDSEGGLLLLSELQGRYCLIAYDANKHQSFAARSPGAGPLYYCLGPDGALSLTNSLSTLPPEEKASDWNELPPGHCIAGKQPRVVQYALTRSQLDLRVYEEEAVDAVAAAIKQELRGDAGGSSGGGSGLGGSSPTGSGLLEALSRRLSRDAVPWYSHEK